ncbi:retron St85 family RNA-directed DNA polymerase [Glacieibacterium sp.]|uniref:retron St85 family RNA-directed DNA polymerase n=1 Tax=Glacieibacterium sp. TaxID=2860237 RepID=UPI003B009CCE
MTKLIIFLAKATGLGESDVRSIVSRAPKSYKHYHIDKRTIGKRLISQPAREVKALQRALVRGLVSLPIHDAAMAYRTGLSIRDNAAKHASNGPIMKFDFKGFFPSIRARDWRHYCRINGVFSNDEDVLISSMILFHKAPKLPGLRLAVGAPSSPWLSNVLMFEFDNLISELVSKDKVVYTRYADDLTFSARRTGYLTKVDRQLRYVVKSINSPALTINEEKTVIATKKFRRVVTGLVLADDGRVTIGRDRKREIRASLHHALAGRMTAEDCQRLIGLLAFVHDVEPAFLIKLQDHYGLDFLDKLRQTAA